MNFFKKEIASRGLKLPNGHGVTFELVADDTGVLATEDGYLISELRNAINRNVGGVYEIKPEEYEELKKNPPDKPLEPPWLSAQKLSQVARQSAANVVVEDGKKKAAEKPVIVEVPQAQRQSVPLEVPQSIPVLTKLGGRKSKTPPPASAPAT